MRSKPYIFSYKKSSPQAYLVKKSGKHTKQFRRRGFYCNLKNLNNYKPMSAGYLKYLIKVLKNNIKIWSEEKITSSYGKNSEKPSIEVKCMKNCWRYKGGNKITTAHFTLKNGKEGSIKTIYPNDCLLRVISAQSGIQPNKLWREITRNLRKLKSITNPKVPVTSINHDVTGGAKYSGNSKTDAKRILDQSQTGKSHPDMTAGHPRGHASYSQATEINESVENYSKSSKKTGFLSRSDQDLVTHFVLITNDAQDAMELLNEEGKKGIKEVVRVRAKDLRIDEINLPDIQDWYKGEKIGSPGRIKDVVVVMKHYYKKYEDENADVFILTLYPTL